MRVEAGCAVLDCPLPGRWRVAMHVIYGGDNGLEGPPVVILCDHHAQPVFDGKAEELAQWIEGGGEAW